MFLLLSFPSSGEDAVGQDTQRVDCDERDCLPI